MSRKAIRFALLWIGWAGAAAAAQAPPTAEPIDPELEAALQELDEAGVSMSPEELAEMQGGPEPTSSVREQSRRLRALLVTEPLEAKGSAPRVVLDARRAGWRLAGRWRRRSDEPAERGFLRWQHGAQQVRIGDVGLGWGSGLLSAAPGRSASLTVEAPLARFRAGPTSGGSYGDRRALRGGAGGGALGIWRYWAAAGRTAATASVPARNRQAVGWGVTGTGAGLGLLAVRQDGTLGTAVHATFRRAGWSGGVEGAWARPDSGAGDWRAAVAHLVWTGGARWHLEAAGGTAAGGTWFAAGRRPSFLVEDEGSGWALRGVARSPDGWRIGALLAHGEGVDPRRAGDRAQRDRIELAARWRPASGWRLDLCWRRTLEQEWSWSERYPWQPATAAAQDRRMVWTATLERRCDRARWRLRLRSLSDGDASGIRQRHLLQWSGRVACTPRLELRASWSTAWGGDADLVSAAAPLRGVLLPRHWGHWRSETLLAIEYERNGLRCSLAASRRSPEPVEPMPDEWTVWTGLEWRAGGG